MDNQSINKTIQNIQDKIFKKKLDPQMAQIRTIFLVWQEFPMSWEELNDIPLPTFKFIVHLLDKQNEETKSKMNK